MVTLSLFLWTILGIIGAILWYKFDDSENIKARLKFSLKAIPDVLTLSLLGMITFTIGIVYYRKYKLNI